MKRIGIVAQDYDEIFGVHQDYLTLVEEFGTPVPIYPVEKEDFFSTYGIDGLLLPGGADVNPRRYKALFSFMSGKPNPYHEYFDTEILPMIIATNTPIFGICRGLQTLNVFLGGTLHQHLWKHPKSTFKTQTVHNVHNGDKKGFPVNSFHHQAIHKLAPGLLPQLWSEDGLVEAFMHEILPIAAVQWHPERIRDEYSLKLMESIFS